MDIFNHSFNIIFVLHFSGLERKKNMKLMHFIIKKKIVKICNKFVYNSKLNVKNKKSHCKIFDSFKYYV